MYDVEKNPGTKRTTVRIGNTGNMLIGVYIVGLVQNEMWSVRAVSGGNPTNLRKGLSGICECCNAVRDCKSGEAPLRDTFKPEENKSIADVTCCARVEMNTDTHSWEWVPN